MNSKQKITEILKTYTKKHNISASSVILEEYAEELIRQGVICPPCKVGQTVYYICGGIVYELKITTIMLCKNDVIYSAPPTYLSEKDFGKTVFLTKEEAEKALAERGKE